MILGVSYMRPNMASAAESSTDTIYVHLSEGGVHAFPESLLAGWQENTDSVVFTATDGTVFRYAANSVSAVDRLGFPSLPPTFTSYKFNNKYNDQLFTDAIGEIVGDSLITASVGCIGKTLVASFKISDDEGVAYIGDVAQESKESRNRFNKDIVYTLGRDNWKVLSLIQKDSVHTGYSLMPWGRNYTVRVTWLTDSATSVPRIDINTENGEMVSSKAYYLNAEIIIDGMGVYPSMTDSVLIKGRGNSSWSNDPWAKNPYRLKFSSKKKPLGMTAGKNWVLIANKIGPSMMCNAAAMKAAALVGSAVYNHIVPVELYINGNYRGSYNLTEKIGFSNNSIDLDDESKAVLLEMDTYYDEDYRFRTSNYSLPVNVKEPDFSEQETALTFDELKSDFNTVAKTVKDGGDWAKLIDVDELAKYFFVNELTDNFEILHPKSTYLYRENLKDENSKYIFGPVWDFDWAFGYQLNRNHFNKGQTVDFWTEVKMEASDFMYALRYTSDDFGKAYYRVWTDFMNGKLSELLQYCTDYYNFAKTSFVHNATIWSDGKNYAVATANMQSWLRKRANAVYPTIKWYDLSEEEETPDGIENVKSADEMGKICGKVDVFDLHGRCVKRGATAANLTSGLPAGIYIVNGQKLVIR